MPADRLERVFDRYYRLDASRSETGCGLGLAYARAVARTHGGDLTLRSSPGVSTCFRLELPRVAAVSRVVAGPAHDDALA